MLSFCDDKCGACERCVERQAHDTILKWARSGARGIGQPVMRDRVPKRGACFVLDLASSEPWPGGLSSHRPKTLAEGPTWGAWAGLKRDAP
jgi:hypothetical protein